MKTCSACKETKPLSEFNWKSKSKGTRQSRCKTCYSDYNRGYYHAGEKVKQIPRAVKNRSLLWDKYIQYKETLRCTVCGESARECLEFHHTDPTKKDINPSLAATYSTKKFLEEIDKCVVLCANCHRKVHSGTITI